MNDFAAMNAAYAEFFTEPYPARSTVQAARLPRASFVVLESRQAGKQFHSPDTDSYTQRTGARAADEGRGLFSYNPVTQVI